MRARLGVDAAAALWRLTERALGRLEELAGDAFARVGSLRLAADLPERDELRAEYEALRADGFDARWREELDAPLRGRFHGALLHPGDGALQPVLWVRRLAAAAIEAGAELAEGVRVDALGELPADEVVIATDGYTGGLVPDLDRSVEPARGQILVTEPLPRRLFACPHYARHGFDYWQQLRDGRLLVGGWRDASFETEATAVEETTPLIQSRIEEFAAQLLGAPPSVAHRWAGIFGVTRDGLPLVGPLPGREGVWAACGYCGHGNVLGLASGRLVAQAILGRAAPELELLDPGRLLPQASPSELDPR
jgi:glycine/D-amino acid oxidase-like deaminating enzyme